ncbi:unnamed protein product [Phytomonas sp. EM1]|nr:unnamed protein product [Phytomonas sp. EM1]|eukprot:CCW65437.1 unnamed protein product [Phytomonas sp. isolate EM1]
MHPDLSSLLRALQLQKGAQRKVPRKQLAACVTVLFPDPANCQSSGQPRHEPRNSSSRYVSPGWQDALALLELSRYSVSPRTQEKVPESHPSANTVETEIAETILNLGRFPIHSGGWTIALSVLERWRQLQGPAHSRSFPSSLSVAAAANLAYLLSFIKSAGEEGASPSWQEVLGLYQHAVQHTLNTATDSRTDPSLLRRMRHTASSALLHNGEWLRALHLFTHSLYQRDAPDCVSTGHLIQHLGRMQQWEAAFQVYNLCVALLQRERATPRCRRSVELQQKLAKQWGTTLSMAMTAVSKEGHQPHLLTSMLEALLRASEKLPPPSSSGSASSTPLVQLDGNFLDAVQSVESKTERVEILEKARQANLLDYYKLIRGLTSKGKLDEAMAVFKEAIQSDPPSLSRREIGLSRLHLLHISPPERVEATVAALHQVASWRRSSELLLNDSEVECVLAKALKITTSPPLPSLPASSTSTSAKEFRASSFWMYCLQILEKNYPDFWHVGAKASRKPTLASLSFLLRNASLPWQIALLIVNKQRDLPEESPSAAPQKQWDTPFPSTTIASCAADETQSVPTRVLLLNAAAQLLYDQGQSSRADELSLSVIRDFQVSPSATFLMRCSWSMLAQVLFQGDVSVDSRVLFHILHDHRSNNSQDPSYSLRPFVIVSLPMDAHANDARGSWLPDRVLAHINGDVDFKQLLSKSERHASDASSTTLHKQPSHRSYLTCVPGSIHVEVLRRLAEPVPWADEELRWELVVSYLDRLAPPLPPPAAEDTGDSESREKIHERYYCAVYEAILTLLRLLPDLPFTAPSKTDALLSANLVCGDPDHSPLVLPSVQEKIRLLQQLIGCAITQLQFIPPAHMLLPNQTDRLLPRLPVAEGKSERGLAESVARCAVAEALVRSSCEVLQGRAAGPGHGLSSLGPVTFHRLLKLCCRVGEYQAGWGPTEQPRATGGIKWPGDTPSLEACAQQLIQWQGERCGIHTVNPGSLLLLYKLCAIRGQQWERALRVTRDLLDLEERADRAEEKKEGGGVYLPEGSLYKRVNREPTHRGKRVVQARHYQLYQSLFGWEHGLQLWFDHFPNEVMQRVSENPEAINWCFSVSDARKK